MSLSQYDSIIIGAGLSGIATALRLRHKGHSVLVLEKNDKVGGKLDEKSWNDFRWDKGPSLFTDPDQILDLFKLFDKEPKDHFSFLELEESCRYFDNDLSLTLFKDRQKSIDQIESLLGGQQAKIYNKY